MPLRQAIFSWGSALKLKSSKRPKWLDIYQVVGRVYEVEFELSDSASLKFTLLIVLEIG